MKPSSPSTNTNLSIIIGLWVGLTLLAGGGVFALVYWVMGGFDTAVEAPTPQPDQPLVLATAPLPTTAPATPVPNTTKVVCNYAPLAPSKFGYGIQSHVYVGQTDFEHWMSVIRGLGLQWVKIQVRWHDLEPQPGQINWSFLDGAMQSACSVGVRVMFSVVAAPEWTQANPMPLLENGEGVAPPDDYQVFANFLGQLVEHYPGQIRAIEVWNEQNLVREWNTAGGVNAAEYIKLLQAAHAAIKARDKGITVISGALSPTGVNCNVSFPNCQPSGRPIVVDDVTYLKAFIDGGGLNYADCVGTHSNGTNLPPLSDGQNPPPHTDQIFLGPWNSPHYSWALKSQVETYAKLLNGQKQQCLTEFGYASAIEGKFRPGFEFAVDTTEEEQGQYLVEAYNWMRDSGLVKMAFLFNLDYAPKGGEPDKDDNVIFSILNKSGLPRPAFDAISKMDKP